MVEATISYLAAMPERPFFFLYDPPPGTPWRNTRGDRRPMPIRDARQLDPPPSLDREGFTLARHVTAVEDLYDEQAVRGVYYRELETLVKDVTGAARVVAFDHNLRSAARAGKGEDGVQGPVRYAHNDYTERSGPAGPGPARRGGRAGAPRPVRGHQRLEADPRSGRAGAARGVRRAHDPRRG